jgi:hypothetical protein
MPGRRRPGITSMSETEERRMEVIKIGSTERADAMVAAWLAGVSLGQLAALLNAGPARVEGDLRDAISTRIGGSEAARDDIQKPNDSMRGRKTSAPKKQSAGRRPVVAAPRTGGAYDAYPEAIRDPRGVSMRAVWDALAVEPMTTSQIATAAGVTSGSAMQAIGGLRQKNLVRGNEGVPVVWHRV